MPDHTSPPAPLKKAANEAPQAQPKPLSSFKHSVRTLGDPISPKDFKVKGLDLRHSVPSLSRRE